MFHNCCMVVTACIEPEKFWPKKSTGLFFKNSVKGLYCEMKIEGRLTKQGIIQCDPCKILMLNNSG